MSLAALGGLLTLNADSLALEPAYCMTVGVTSTRGHFILCNDIDIL